MKKKPNRNHAEIMFAFESYMGKIKYFLESDS